MQPNMLLMSVRAPSTMRPLRVQERKQSATSQQLILVRSPYAALWCSDGLLSDCSKHRSNPLTEQACAVTQVGLLEHIGKYRRLLR